MDEYIDIIGNKAITPELQEEIVKLNKRQNRLINKIDSVLMSMKNAADIKSQNTDTICIENLERYFEQLRATNINQHMVMLGLLKRICREQEKDNTRALQTNQGSLDVSSQNDISESTHHYYNRYLPRLNNFYTKKRRK